MKFLSAIVFGLFFALAVFAQSDVSPSNDKVSVTEIFLAKDDGAGKPGDAVENFATTDVPIYCVVQLDSMTPAAVRMNFIAVSVKGVKGDSQIISIKFKTNGEQSRVYFTGKPAGRWIPGTYRADIFIDDKPAGSKQFVIQTPPREFMPVKSFQPKAKLSRQARRN